MISKPLYRIRWARVSTRYGTERMCIAERLTFGLFYWPVEGGWRAHEGSARLDIAMDRDLRAPLPPVEEFDE